jgi:hypothetical protein
MRPYIPVLPFYLHDLLFITLFSLKEDSLDVSKNQSSDNLPIVLSDYNLIKKNDVAILLRI